MSGLIADAKTLIDKARVETQVYIYIWIVKYVLVKELIVHDSFSLLQNHWFTYNETMTVESVTQAVSNLALQFGEEDADPGAMASTVATAWRLLSCDFFGFAIFLSC